MRGFGGMLAFEVRGGLAAGARVVERFRAGITDGLIRISVGIEDILADLAQALG